MYPEGGATPVNMFTSTLSNQFMTREGEAPAEPWRRQLGRSLALPMGLLDSETYRAERAIHTAGCLEYGRKSGPYCRQPLTWVERDAVTGETPSDTLQETKGATV